MHVGPQFFKFLERNNMEELDKSNEELDKKENYKVGECGIIYNKNCYTTTDPISFYTALAYPKIEITLNYPDSKKPEKSDENAGYDLFSIENVTVRPGMRANVNIGVSMALPEGWVGLIWPKSGHAVKLGLDVLAGVIDHSYRGDIIVCLLNTGYDAIQFPKGTKVAQILIQEYKSVAFRAVDKLSETKRGSGGFGSTGA